LANHRSIGEIAHLAGYGDAAAFSRAFRRRFGAPPREWQVASARSLETKNQIF
jgi:AraC-like DNA-binding protein